MFKENFIKLCNKAGKTPTAVCAEIGLSNAAYSKWDEKSVPHRATLLKIADYFGVPADTLLEGEGNPPEDARLISLMKTLTAEEKTALENFINYLIKKRK
jgi:transcriptional regulator with XRE-family HTH domain